MATFHPTIRLALPGEYCLVAWLFPAALAPLRAFLSRLFFTPARCPVPLWSGTNPAPETRSSCPATASRVLGSCLGVLPGQRSCERDVWPDVPCPCCWPIFKGLASTFWVPCLRIRTGQYLCLASISSGLIYRLSTRLGTTEWQPATHWLRATADPGRIPSCSASPSALDRAVGSRPGAARARSPGARRGNRPRPGGLAGLAPGRFGPLPMAAPITRLAITSNAIERWPVPNAPAGCSGCWPK